jgi:hypothetical protein
MFNEVLFKEFKISRNKKRNFAKYFESSFSRDQTFVTVANIYGSNHSNKFHIDSSVKPAVHA